MATAFKSGALALGLLLASPFLVSAQAPNTLAQYNPNIRTASLNATWFILPVNTQNVQSVVPYPLLPVPNDPTLFPGGFPAGTHPVLVSAGYMNDIRMITLNIPALLDANVYVPFVDKLGDGRTPFAYPAQNYIGGINGDSVQAVVPSLVGSAEGTNIEVAIFDPISEAYKSDGLGTFSQDVKMVIVPTPPSGPGVNPTAFDTLFQTATRARYTSHTFHSLVNQPIILSDTAASNGSLMLSNCQRNTIYFNETFANPVMRTGNVTLYGQPGGALPAALNGNYANVGGFSATGEMVGYNAQDCRSAAAAVDPAASR